MKTITSVRYAQMNLKKKASWKEWKRTIQLLPQWNSEEVCVFDKEIFLSSPHFSGTTVTDCFEWKDYLDSKLESDFMKIDSKPPQRLSFKETYSIFILKGSGEIVRGIIKFIPEFNKENFNYEPYKAEMIDVLKIREDLYVIVAVDNVVY